jgi:phosphohistidine phosphatase
VKVVLLRHGIAVDPMDPASPPDAERPLTRKGVRRTRRAAAGLATLGVAPDVVFTSPLARATQTAEIAAAVLGCSDVREATALGGGIHTREVFDLLAASDAGQVLCVGHAPQLDLFLAQTLGAGHPAVAKLKKAGAALVEFDFVALGGGHLAWIMAPRALRRLAGG